MPWHVNLIEYYHVVLAFGAWFAAQAAHWPLPTP